ncbi:MAG: HAMP domain-containing histidine kinase [Lachnospiraceae bacterium]|nr:HAMP domain-containing histidine kinase [Lachnospiraceae bacterium]
MEEEKKLRDSLIRRFIFVLIITGIVGHIFVLLSDRFAMPAIAGAVFPEYETTEAFSATAIAAYVLILILNKIISGVTRWIPGFTELPGVAYLGRVLTERERAFFVSGSSRAFAELSDMKKAILILLILAILLVLSLPYVTGAVYFSMVTMRDFRRIAEKRKARAIEEAKRQNLMISDIAHDLRTPVTTITGYARALCDGLVKEEEKQSYLEAILNKSAGMTDLIQLLFDYTRLDSKGFELKKEKTDLCELVRECAASLYTDAETAGMEMEIEIPEKELFFEIDRPQFTRVIANLITNAVRHNEEGCSIGIFVVEDMQKTIVAVADDGKKIPEDLALRIFEPFFMGDESRNSRGGSGLGLSVALKIADMHGFRLFLEQGSRLKTYPVPEKYAKAFLIEMRNSKKA